MPTQHTNPDTESDPAHDHGQSADWSGEGGATEEGPATDQDADDVPGGEK